MTPRDMYANPVATAQAVPMGGNQPAMAVAQPMSAGQPVMAVATPLSTVEGVDEAVRTAFQTYDVDGSGALTKDEAKNMVKTMNLGVSEQYVDGVWSVYDTDGNGTLDMQEFTKFFEVLVRRNQKGPAPMAVGMAVAQPMQSQAGFAVAQPIGQPTMPVAQPMGQMQMIQPQMMQSGGVAALAAFGDLFIKQRVEMLEAMTGFETANSYDILGTTAMGMHPVFVAHEKSGCCERNCCGASRSFTMNIFSQANPLQPIFRIERPLRCKPPVCCCYLQELTVLDGSGAPIGRLEQQYDCCGSDMDIILGNTVVYKIAGPCCVCDGPCWGDQQFYINTPQGEHINTPGGLARITKMGTRGFGDVAQEMFTDADNFGCTFPPTASPEAKAVLLAAVRRFCLSHSLYSTKQRYPRGAGVHDRFSFLREGRRSG